MAEEDLKNSEDYKEALEDVHTRFILNLPPSELETADRMFFQLEQAWWFYEDWICDKNTDKKLPRFKNLKPFALELFGYSELLPDPKEFSRLWIEFSTYKRGISNYGCIILSEDYTKIVLCKVWNGKSVTFPAGKINQGEEGINAAARETYEETGFDVSCTFGLTADWKINSPKNITWKPLREEDALEFREDNGKRRTCYVCHGVPTDFPFEPVARKEVSSVDWYPVDNIPKSSYGVFPFLSQLKRWIKKHKRSNSKMRDKSSGRSNSRKKGTPGRSRNSSRAKVRQDDALVSSGLAKAGEQSGWSEQDMFKANEKLLGRKVTYDGNPHTFEEGFGGQDPHAFHVVGGNFLNSEGGISSLAPPPETSRLQPLFRTKADGDDLQPFFSDDGVTPWGDTVDEAKGWSPPRGGQEDAQALLSMLQGGSKKKPATLQVDKAGFMTDAQITAMSQAKTSDHVSKSKAKHLENQQFIDNWVSNLPKPNPTKRFGVFKLDADTMVAKAMAHR